MRAVYNLDDFLNKFVTRSGAYVGTFRSSPLRRRIVRHVNRAVDLILPPLSIITGELKQDGNVTANATENWAENGAENWTSIRFLDDPCCDLCGFPFEFDMGKGVLCARCIARPPTCEHMRAAFAYNDASRKMVLDFKHGGKTAGLSMFGIQMARAGRSFLNDADFIIPVPLHYKRLVKRRYNQSALLAREVAKRGPAQLRTNILHRHKATETQGGKSTAGRRRNVQGAFSVAKSAKNQIKGMHVVLVDDVLTTGATLDACAKTLLRAGAACVDGLSLARVVSGTAIPT